MRADMAKVIVERPRVWPLLALSMVWALIAIVALALIFDFINGFHDAANSIATVVSTGVLKPQQAVVFAAFTCACAASRVSLRAMVRWRRAVAVLGLSARAHHRVLKLARTIADLAGKRAIAVEHVSEAMSLRRLDRMRNGTTQDAAQIEMVRLFPKRPAMLENGVISHTGEAHRHGP